MSMSNVFRFGRRLPLPSTAEIKHELRLAEAANRLVEASSDVERDQIVGDLTRLHGISPDRAQMLADRFHVGRVSVPPV